MKYQKRTIRKKDDVCRCGHFWFNHGTHSMTSFITQSCNECMCPRYKKEKTRIQIRDGGIFGEKLQEWYE